MTDSITVSARAKLNLFLRVLARDEDGYHSLETLFARLALADELTATRRDSGVTLEVIGADTGPDAENLAVRAAEMVLAALRTKFGVHLRLEKKIPVGGGLGGGSADAAAALEAVNALAGNAIPRAELLQFAARLGSDVAFCFSGASLALGWSPRRAVDGAPATASRSGPAAGPAGQREDSRGLSLGGRRAEEPGPSRRGGDGPRGRRGLGKRRTARGK